MKALGMVVLRRMDRCVMCRRLAAITLAYPHTDEEASSMKGITAIYDDTLEFSFIRQHLVDQQPQFSKMDIHQTWFVRL